VLLHSPQSQTPNISTDASSQQRSSDVKFLNVNREITSLTAGRLNGMDRDVLVIGTSNSAQVFDTFSNRDLFFKNLSETCSSACTGIWSHEAQSTVFLGGNCSITGCDALGKDKYWTVTGDVVASMCFYDIDGDGSEELLVGTDDFDIRLYRGDDIINEATETDKITVLVPISRGKFAYALANGTVGVYNGSSMVRIWRVKAKSRVTSLTVFDIDSDGAPEIVAGFANGRLEVRRVANGELVYRDMLSGYIAGLAVSDYRADGKPLLLTLTVDGELRGYSQTTSDVLNELRGQTSGNDASAGLTPRPMSIAMHAGVAAGATVSRSVQDSSVSSLLAERASLEAELLALEAPPPAASSTSKNR
jgi:Bardet-Biedl syndrome 2 protein